MTRLASLRQLDTSSPEALKRDLGRLVQVLEDAIASVAVGLPRAGTVRWVAGIGTPEGVVSAPVGSLYTDTGGGASTTLYVKETGAGPDGWVAK